MMFTVLASTAIFAKMSSTQWSIMVGLIWVVLGLSWWLLSNLGKKDE